MLFLAAAFSALSVEAASPYCNRVIDYVPAPGQFVNTLPEWEAGDDGEAMSAKVYEYLQNGDIITLGAYGGYVTFGFEKTIVNVPGKRDFYIEGNATQAKESTTAGGSSEPGVVMVAYDMNRNGLPDDNEWFEIAGSEYSRSTRGYKITYHRPATDTEDIKWTDNRNNSGFVSRNRYHAQPYWPQWMQDDELVFCGTLLPENGKNEGTDENPYYVLSRFDFGYADNYPNYSDTEYRVRSEGAMINIDWAVDKDGNPVKMPGVDFVRIYTGVNQSNGWLGECSTEVGRIANVHTVVSGNEEIVDESVRIDESVLSDFLAKYGGSSVGQISDGAVNAYVDYAGGLRFSLPSPSRVELYDQTGRMLRSGWYDEGDNVMDLGGYAAGVYVFKAGNCVRKVLKRR